MSQATFDGRTTFVPAQRVELGDAARAWAPVGSADERAGEARGPGLVIQTSSAGSRPRGRSAVPTRLVEAGRRRTPMVAVGGAAVLVAGTALTILSRSSPATTTQLLEDAFALQRSGRTAEASALYDSVIAREPWNHVAQFNLGVIHHENGSLLQAVRRYEAALAANAEFVPALMNLAAIRRERSPQLAVRHYRQVVRVDPTHAGAHLELGLLLLGVGEQITGSAHIDRALALDPSLRLE